MGAVRLVIVISRESQLHKLVKYTKMIDNNKTRRILSSATRELTDGGK